MARIRTIKPEFFTSEDVVSLTPHARLLYIALWCEADREGRLKWKPQTFRIRYFPTDPVDIDSLTNALIERGLVKLYGHELAYIPTFPQHQHINPRESQSVLPPPVDASVTRRSRVSDVQVGREGREGKVVASEDDAQSVLAHLNDKTGKAFRPVPANLSLISARLAEGATVDECKAVIDSKVTAWATDDKMRGFLRPKTLFAAGNFASYVGDIGSHDTTEASWE